MPDHSQLHNVSPTMVGNLRNTLTMAIKMRIVRPVTTTRMHTATLDTEYYKLFFMFLSL